MADVKVAVLEVDGVELDIATERVLHAQDTDFDNAGAPNQGTKVQSVLQAAVSMPLPSLTFASTGKVKNRWLNGVAGVSSNVNSPELRGPTRIKRILFKTSNTNSAQALVYLGGVLTHTITISNSNRKSDELDIAVADGLGVMVFINNTDTARNPIVQIFTGVS